MFLARNVTVKRISDGCASSMVVDSLVPNVDFEPPSGRRTPLQFSKSQPISPGIAPMTIEFKRLLLSQQGGLYTDFSLFYDFFALVHLCSTSDKRWLIGNRRREHKQEHIREHQGEQNHLTLIYLIRYVAVKLSPLQSSQWLSGPITLRTVVQLVTGPFNKTGFTLDG